MRARPIGFAHRGARAHAPENTLEAFALALRLGATGLESDVWLTADGVPVLDHDGVVGRVRRRPIRAVTRAELPPHVPAVAELYEACGDAFELSVDVKDPAAAVPLIDAARAASAAAVGRLWLCHHDHDLLLSWREHDPSVRLVDSTRLKRLSSGAERHAAVLREKGIDAVNLHHSDWTGGLTTLFHRFGVLAFGWDCQFARVLDGLLAMGIDAVYSDHVDRMVEALAGR
ncbi:MAG: glycerophosphodiester phosphodiesterase [Actinobacteria bacterium]|nr:glycerophosphodiester phosphodiesterase [Actinomycetota bacterium]